MSTLLQDNCHTLRTYRIGDPCMWKSTDDITVFGHVVGFKYNTFQEIIVVLQGIGQHSFPGALVKSEPETYVVHPLNSMVKLQKL